MNKLDRRSQRVAAPQEAAGKLTVVYRPIAELIPDPKNPRLHSRRQVRQIARSIETFGFNVPILVDRLVAVLGSSHMKDSAETVRRYKETRFHKNTSGGYDDSTIAALRNLPPDHSFVDAIEALIAAAADGSLETAMYVDVSEFEGVKIGYEAIIEITVQTPGQLGDISIRGGDASGHGRYALPNPYDQHQSLYPPTEEVDAWKQKVSDYHVESDLTQYRKVTAKTILEVRADFVHITAVI
jgi:hypothetical protein